MSSELTMDKTQIRKAFVWAHKNGYEHLVENFLHDIEELIYDSLILEGCTKPKYWYNRLLYAADKAVEINTLYQSATGKSFARFYYKSRFYDASNFVREIALALIPGHTHKYAEDVPPNFPYHKGNNRPCKYKMRSALAWLKENGEEQIVRFILIYIRRIIDTAISMNYPVALVKRTNNIRRVSTRVHWVKKKLKAEGFKEHFFRKVLFDEEGNEDMMHYVEEIAGALIWDYEPESKNSDLQGKPSTLSMHETVL